METKKGMYLSIFSPLSVAINVKFRPDKAAAAALVSVAFSW